MGAPIPGLPVAGYRDQSASNVDQVNINKGLEELVLRQLDALADNTEVDQRWLAIGRSHIEQGFMAVNRSVFKPVRATAAAELYLGTYIGTPLGEQE